MEKIEERNKAIVRGENPINKSELLQLAYENSAPHIVNLEQVHRIVIELKRDTESTNECINELSKISKETDVTLRTDIRILLNEIKHLVAGQKKK